MTDNEREHTLRESGERHLDAVTGAIALLAGTTIFAVGSVRLGFVNQYFGFGIYKDAVLLALLAFLATTAAGVLLGVVLAKYLQWRYDTRLVILNGGEDLEEWR